MKHVRVGFVIGAVVLLGCAAYVEYQRLCCGPRRIPLEQYLQQHEKAERDRIATQPSGQNE